MTLLADGPAYELEPWHDFAVAEVSAAAALAGLLVVAISINISRLLELPHVVSRLNRTLVLFGTVLVTASLLLVPGLHPRTAGVAIAVVAVVAAAAAGRVHGLRTVAPEHRRTAMTAAVAAALAAVLMALGGVSLAVGMFGGLYWFVAGVLLAFVVGIANGWVALVEILR